MEDFIWRTYARVVAYVELILSILNSMSVFMITIGAGILTTLLTAHEDLESLHDAFKGYRHDVAIWWIWAVVASLVLTTGLQLWASLKLLSATEFGMDVYEALERARIWRNVTFAFAVMVIAGIASIATAFGVAGLGEGAVGAFMATVVGYIIWRGSFLLVVYKYMKELEEALASVGDAEAGYIYPSIFVK